MNEERLNQVAEQVEHTLFAEAMDVIQGHIREQTHRRRFMVVVAEVFGDEVRVHRTTYNFPKAKFGEVVSQLDEMLAREAAKRLTIPDAGQPLPEADLGPSVMQDYGDSPASQQIAEMVDNANREMGAENAPH